MTAVQGITVLITLCLVGCSLCQRTCTTSRVRYSTSSSIQYYSEPYTQSYSCGFWGWSRCTRTRYRSTTRSVYFQTSTYYTTCCSGYSGSRCEAVCTSQCQNGGTCSSPNTCSCLQGWTGRTCSEAVCTSQCQNGGTCSSPNTCSCLQGWTGRTCSEAVCTPQCQNGGTCSSPNTCSCFQGWTGRTCSEDINECSTQNGGCHHICYNTSGSFTCRCRSGFSLASDGMTCNEPPAAPTNITVSSVGQTTATVSWRAPTNNFSNTLTAVSSYHVTASQSVFQEGNRVVTKSSDSTSHIFTDLEEYTTYSFSVVALNTFGQGPESHSKDATTLQAAPSAAPLSVQVSSKGPYFITLEWSPPPPIDRNGVIIYYQLKFEEVETETVLEWTSPELMTTRNSLHPHFIYECSVAAHTSAGTGPFSGALQVQTLSAAPTAAPTEVRVLTYNSTSISLSWEKPPFSDRNGEIVQYHIQVVEQETDTYLQYSTQYQQYILVSLHPYYNYNISIAAETIEVGPFSTVIHLQTLESAPSSAPGNLSVVAINSTLLVLSWSLITPPDRNGIIQEYILQMRELETETTTHFVALRNEYAVHNLHPDYTYHCKVAAKTIAIGPFSSVLEEKLPEDVPSGIPLNFTVETALARSIFLSWEPLMVQDRNGIIRGYEIELSSNVQEHLQTFSVDSRNETLLINGTFIKPFKRYFCRIAAFTAVGTGPLSELISVQTLEDVPSSLNIVRMSPVLGKPTELSIQWDAPLEPNGELIAYTVYCKASNQQPLCECTKESSNSSINSQQLQSPFCVCGGRQHSVTYQKQEVLPVGLIRTTVIGGFVPYTNYTCFMTANTSVGESQPSDTVSAVTEESSPEDPPQNFTIRNVNSTAVHLSWSQPLLPNGIIVAYHINYNLSAFINANITVGAVPTEFDVVGLNEYTAYNFSIYASTHGGDGPSVALVTRTNESYPYSSPREVTVLRIGKRSVEVSWIPPLTQDQNGLLTSYKVKFLQSQFHSIPNITVESSNLSLSYSDLEEHTQYAVVVAAATRIGFGPFSSAIYFITHEDAPASSPTQGVGYTQSSSVVSFYWSAPKPIDQNGIINFYIAMITEIPTGRNWSLVAVHSHITLASLHPYYNYSCVVAAYTVGIGPYSNPFYALTDEEAPNAPPTKPRILSFSSTSILLLWQPPPTENLNGRLRNYTVWYREQETSLHSSVSTNNTSLELIDLHPYFTYIIKVRAETISPGPFSAEQSVQLEEDAPSGSVQNLSAIPLHSQALLLTWMPPPLNEQNGIIRSYEVYVTETETGILRNYTTSSTNITIAHLHPFYTYSCVISALTVSEGPVSNPAIVTTPQDVPSGIVQDLEVSEVYSRRVVLSWMPPEPEYQNGVVTEYHLSIEALDFYFSFHQIFPNTSGEVRNLKPYSTYQVTISASTVIGVGPQSDVFTFQTLEDAPNSPPRNVVVTVRDSHTLLLSWSPPLAENRNGVIQEYIVTLTELDTGKIIEITASTTSVVVSFLHPFYTYSYTVSAVTTDPGPSSSVMNITMPQDVPSASPANLTVTETASNSVALKWTALDKEDRNGIILSYIIQYYRFPTGNVSSIQAHFTEIVVHDLLPHAVYSFSVAARTVVGIGPFSTHLQITTAEAAPSSPPTEVTAAVLDSTTVELSWIVPPTADHNGIIRYFVIIITEIDTGSKSELTVEATLEVVSSLHPFYTYEVVVAAVTTDIGPFSNSIVFQLPEDAPSGPPTNLTVEIISSSSLYVGWNPPPSGQQNGLILNYTVTITDLDEGYYLKYVVLNHSLTMSMLDAHTAYEVFVFATTAGGNGPPTNSVIVYTHEDAPTHGPVNLTVMDIGSTYIYLTWSHPPDDTHQGVIRLYNIYVEEQETERKLLYTTSANETELFIDSLHPFYVYHIKVAAVTVKEGNATSVSSRTDEAAPTASPQNVEVLILGPKSINISWLSIPEKDANGIIHHFIINITVSMEDSQQIITNSQRMFYSLYNLLPFTKYTISIAAVTVDTGPFSDVVELETPESAPTSFPTNISVHILSSKQLQLSWKPPSENTRNGIIRMFVINIFQLSANETTSVTSEDNVVVLDLLPFHHYLLSIAAVTVMKGPFSEPIAIEMPEDVPTESPQDLHVEAISSNSVTVVWVEPDIEFHNGIIRHYIVNVSSQSLKFDLITSDTMINITGLNPFTNYTVTVAAFTVGSGPSSVALSFTTMEALPTGEPTVVRLNALNSSAIYISWHPPLYHHRNGIIRNYIVKLSSVKSGHNATYVVYSEEIVISDLDPFSVYSVGVASENSVGIGPYSRYELVQTLEDAPGAPHNVTFKNLTSTSLYLLWDSPPPDEHNGIIRFYQIHLTENDTGLYQEYRTTNNAYFVDRLHPYYHYILQVQAVTVLPGDQSDTLYITTLQDIPSGPPLNLSSVILNSTHAVVEWKPPSISQRNGIIDHYIINITEADTLDLLPQLSSHSLSLLISDLHPYYTYQVRVAASTLIGIGPYSTLLTFTMDEAAPTGPPLNFTVVVLSSSSLLLSWEPPDIINQNGIIRYYLVSCIDMLTFTESKYRVDSEHSQLVLSALHPYRSYRCTIAAITVAVGVNASPVIITTLDDVPSRSPSAISAMAINSTSISITWSSLEKKFWNGILQNYSLRITELNTGKIIVYSSNMTQMTLSSLHPNYAYEVAVAATTRMGTGPFSVPVIVTTHSDVPSGAPLDVEIQSVLSTSVVASWRNPSLDKQNGDIFAYTVLITSEKGNMKWTVNSTAAYLSSIVLSPLEPFTVYNLTVSAVNINGSGPYSSPLVFTTAHAAPGEAPLGLTAVNISSQAIVLSWLPPPTASHNGVIKLYKLHVVQIETKDSIDMTSLSTKMTLKNLHPYYHYQISVAAVTVDVGPYATITVQTLEDAPSGPPQELTILSVTSTNISLSWNPPRAPEQNGVITGYLVNICDEQFQNCFREMCAETSYTVTGLHPFYTFYFNVAAVTIETGPSSNFIKGTCLEDKPSGAPENVTVQVLTSSSLHMTWSLPDPGDQNGIVRSYTVHVRNIEGDSFQVYSSLKRELTISSLHPYNGYECSVAAVTVGRGPFSTPVPVRTLQDVPSGPPTNVSIFSLSTTSMNVSWMPPPKNQQNGIIQYYVLLLVEDNGYKRRVINGSNMVYTIVNGLHPYYTYKVSVAAFTIGMGPFSNHTEVTLPQDVPSSGPENVWGTSLSPYNIELHWDSPSTGAQNGDIVFYHINITHISSGKVHFFEVPGNRSFYSRNDFHPYYIYICTIHAVTIGAGPGTSVIITTKETVPSSPPLNVTAKALSSTVAKLMWQAPNAESRNGMIREYSVVKVTLPSGDLEELITNETYLDFHRLRPYTNYFFVVAARTVSLGPFSNQTFLSMPEARPLGAIQNVSLSVESATSVEIRWLPPPPPSWNGAILNYTIFVEYVEPVIQINSSDAFNHTFTKIHPTEGEHLSNNKDPHFASLPLLFESVVIGDLQESQVYQFSIVMANSAGWGERSKPIIQELPGSEPSGAPTYIQVCVLSSTSVEVHWKPPHFLHQNGIITGYWIGIAELVSFPLFIFNTTSVNLVVIISDLQGFTDYVVVIAAENIEGRGPLSNPIHFKTLEDVPSAPVNISLKQVNRSIVIVSWDIPKHPNGIIDSYLVWYISSQGNIEQEKRSPYTIIVDAPKLHVTIYNLTTDLSYSFKVCAHTSVGYGSYSNLVSFQFKEFDDPTQPSADGHSDSENENSVGIIVVALLAFGGWALAIGSFVVILICYKRKLLQGKVVISSPQREHSCQEMQTITPEHPEKFDGDCPECEEKTIM